MNVALVTGSNKGIGLALVEKLAKVYNSANGWDVYLTARDEGRGHASCKQLESKGLHIKFHQLDITSKDSRSALLNDMHTKYENGINILVNNAGILHKDMSPESFAEAAHSTMNTNFQSTIGFTLECLPHLANNARVVHMSSTLSRVAGKKMDPKLFEKFDAIKTLDNLNSFVDEYLKQVEAGNGNLYGGPEQVYGLSKLSLLKGAVILGETLKNDPRLILMNTCCPGYVDTDMTDHKGVKTVENGAETPFFLATLPAGSTGPMNEFINDYNIKKWIGKPSK